MKIDIDVFRQIEREKGIDFHTVVEAFEAALASAYKRSQQSECDEARVVVSRATGEITVFGQELDDEGNIVREWEEEVHDFGRIVAQTAKQVLLQRLREAEREVTYGEYSGREGDVVSGTVSLQGNVTLLQLGRTEALLPFGEQVPNERLDHGQHTKALVIEVRRQQRGAQIVTSRRHEGFVAALFAFEVPEIQDGIVEIMGVARDAGHRTKVSVRSHDGDVDPVGACVGPAGQRAKAVQRELHNEGLERIDIVRWSEDPVELVANALSPAKVTDVYLYEDEGAAVVVVPDHMLSLAIGREGQNARLAYRLTGWRIDIKSEGQFAEEQKAFQEAFEAGLVDEYGNPLNEEGAAAVAAAVSASEEVTEAALEEAEAAEDGPPPPAATASTPAATPTAGAPAGDEPAVADDAGAGEQPDGPADPDPAAAPDAADEQRADATAEADAGA